MFYGWKTHLLALAYTAAAVVAWRWRMLSGAEAFDAIGVALFGSALRRGQQKTCSQLDQSGFFIVSPNGSTKGTP